MEIQVVSLKIKREKKLKISERFTSSPVAGAFFIKHIGSADREHMAIVTLDAKMEANYMQIASIGTLNEAPAHPREIFKLAVLTNSCYIMIAHNHPSGSLVPSQADIEMTRRTKDAGELLGIKLLDHLIVTDVGYKSLAEQDLI